MGSDGSISNCIPIMDNNRTIYPYDWMDRVRALPWKANRPSRARPLFFRTSKCGALLLSILGKSQEVIVKAGFLLPESVRSSTIVSSKDQHRQRGTPTLNLCSLHVTVSVSPHDDVNPNPGAHLGLASPHFHLCFLLQLLVSHSYSKVVFSFSYQSLSLCDPNYLEILFRPSDTKQFLSDLVRPFAPPDFCPQRASLPIRRQARRLLELRRQFLFSVPSSVPTAPLNKQPTPWHPPIREAKMNGELF